MEYVQETIAVAKDDTRFTIHISNEEGSPHFALQMLMWNPNDRVLASFSHGFPWTVAVPRGPYANAEAAFDAAATALGNYQTRKGGVIARVHNPCNTPFVSLEDQHRLLGQHGVVVQPTK